MLPRGVCFVDELAIRSSIRGINSKFDKIFLKNCAFGFFDGKIYIDDFNNYHTKNSTTFSVRRQILMFGP